MLIFCFEISYNGSAHGVVLKLNVIVSKHFILKQRRTMEWKKTMTMRLRHHHLSCLITSRCVSSLSTVLNQAPWYIVQCSADIGIQGLWFKAHELHTQYKEPILFIFLPKYFFFMYCYLILVTVTSLSSKYKSDYITKKEKTWLNSNPVSLVICHLSAIWPNIIINWNFIHLIKICQILWFNAKISKLTVKEKQ